MKKTIVGNNHNIYMYAIHLSKDEKLQVKLVKYEQKNMKICRKICKKKYTKNVYY